MITRQCADCLAQGPYVHLAAQAIARCRGAIQVTTRNLNLSVLLRTQRCVAAFKLQRHALRQEVFDREFIQLRLAVAQVEHQLPTPGRRLACQCQGILIKAQGVWLPDKLAADLLVRATHFYADRLRLDRLAVAITQQSIEQHGFAGAVQVTRAKHKKLQRVRLRAGNVELGQIQRRRVQA